DEIHEATGIDPWFLYQLQDLLDAERWFAALGEPDAAEVGRMKRMGFSDPQLAALRNTTEAAFRERRWKLGVHPAYKMVDTCAGEFPSSTPYLYSSYDEEHESQPLGPDRLGVTQTPNGTARSVAEAGVVAQRIGYPVLVRPSYVLGGRAMEIVYDEASLKEFFEKAARVAPEHPVLIDHFLEDAFEADVD